MIQLAVVATYFLSAIAKIREGGWLWGSSATLIWALSRRGDVQPAQWLSTQPALTYAMQWTVFVAELSLAHHAVAAEPGAARRGGLLDRVPRLHLRPADDHFLPTAICLSRSCRSSGSAGAAPGSTPEAGGVEPGEPASAARRSRARGGAAQDPVVGCGTWPTHGGSPPRAPADTGR